MLQRGIRESHLRSHWQMDSAHDLLKSEEDPMKCKTNSRDFKIYIFFIVLVLRPHLGHSNVPLASIACGPPTSRFHSTCSIQMQVRNAFSSRHRTLRDLSFPFAITDLMDLRYTHNFRLHRIQPIDFVYKK